MTPAIYDDNFLLLLQISGAKVKLKSLISGSSERIVEISGTPDQTHAAQSLLQAFVLSGQ
jgi:poly(rC)-binding protein 2/3/4